MATRKMKRSTRKTRKSRRKTQRKGGYGSDTIRAEYRNSTQDSVLGRLTVIADGAGDYDLDVDVSKVPNFMEQLKTILTKLTSARGVEKSFLQRAVSKVGNTVGNVGSSEETIEFVQTLISNNGRAPEVHGEDLKAYIKRLNKAGV